MKNTFRNGFSDRRGGFLQAGLRFIRLLFGHSGLDPFDKRLHRVERGAISLMAPVGLASSSNRRFMNGGHR